MKTVTLPKTKYEILRKRASLYEEIFRFLPEKIFGMETYSKKRIKEFLKEDKMDRKTRNRLQKLLKSL
ncbi:MAG: hypothetical protein COU43_02865 [Candidatus Nealsonbacteria bacterium CG10_big_fil_rev_8_21_14_0_10_37_25]|uniref:Uncharacterized protein n=2 Tax=Parcubacteria group TaxID=1794811 RepID=A0A2H0TK94_9BACT|nr:MAG: hypothetical protein COW86_05355 [Candidatus Kuenenbacteria bacterium CG22_combo_CG10-13_8_21_14_all_39_9]PIR71404.1 MAG: hypothetical protein COU43_02865 [Candidatus Nealsonbacteria bacterium CG10_big_fil_rev_8_21_14_0_10_37_25]